MMAFPPSRGPLPNPQELTANSVKEQGYLTKHHRGNPNVDKSHRWKFPKVPNPTA